MTLSKKICALAVCATLVLLQSCAKEELDLNKLNQFSEPKNITVSASLPQASNTSKTTIDFNDNGKVLWETTDAISVNGTTLSSITVSSADKRNATFSGEVSPLSGTHYWGVYPTSIATDKNVSGNYTTSAVKVNLPITQTYQHDAIPSFMVAHCTTSGNEVPLSFKNLCSIIKIPVQAASGVTGTSAQLKKIEVYALQDITGTATVSWNNGNPTITISGSKKITLDCGNTNVTSQKYFYIMVPAGSSTQDLTLNFCDNSGKCMQKKLTGISLTRSRIHTTNVVNLNATLDEPWVSGDFSVSSTQKIRFSHGNLQYIGSAATPYWKFADDQWAYLGNNGQNNNTQNIDRDLFAWGCTGYPDTRSYYQTRYQPWETSNAAAYGEGTQEYTQNQFGYGPDYTIAPGYNLTIDNHSDWGYLEIKESSTSITYPSGAWRTLTNDEWTYLLTGRVVNGGQGEHYSYEHKYITLANSSTINGLLLFPDDFTGQVPSGTTITWNEWHTLENSGVVFLSTSGYDYSTYSVYDVGNQGHYWSSTPYNGVSAYFISFGNDYIWTSTNRDRYFRRAVRLTQNAN